MCGGVNSCLAGEKRVEGLLRVDLDVCLSGLRVILVYFKLVNLLVSEFILSGWFKFVSCRKNGLMDSCRWLRMVYYVV